VLKSDTGGDKVTKHYQQRKESNKRYLAKFDEVRIRLPKGQKSVIEAAANEAGESVNQYTQKALLARIGLESWPEKKED
jgi:predicted HicB family RNase H-like nuclease